MKKISRTCKFSNIKYSACFASRWSIHGPAFGNVDASPMLMQQSYANAILSRFEQKDSNLAKIEVDEMLGFVSYIAAEVAADNAMPCGVVLFVELLLDVGSDVLFDVKRCSRRFNGGAVFIIDGNPRWGRN